MDSRHIKRYRCLPPAHHRPHVSISAGFPSGVGFLGNPTAVPYPVDTCSSLSTTRGYSVPPLRMALHEGPHSSPGFSGVSLGHLENCPALIRAILAQADNPRRLVQRNDDSDMGSSACPYAALLDGIPGRMPSDRLFSPLDGLMVSRYRRGYALTSPPEGQELHLHREKVVEDRLIYAPSPPLSLWDGSSRETDRTFPGRAGGYPAGPPTDPDVRDERIRFLGRQSLGTSLAPHCATLQATSDIVDDAGCGEDRGLHALLERCPPNRALVPAPTQPVPPRLCHTATDVLQQAEVPPDTTVWDVPP